MHTLRRRLPGFGKRRLDAKLVDFDMPTRDRRCQCAKHARAETQQRAHGGAVADNARDRLEPARATAIERVVVDTLPVRLMRLALDRGVAPSLEPPVTTPPVTPPTRHKRPTRA